MCQATPCPISVRPACCWPPTATRLASAAAVGVAHLFARLIPPLVGRCGGGVMLRCATGYGTEIYFPQHLQSPAALLLARC